MESYNFQLVVAGVEITNDDVMFDVSDSLYEAGCADGTVAAHYTTLYVTFNRKAESFERAIVSAIQNVEAVEGLTVAAVDGDWVGLSDAAELSGMTKATLSRYNSGERGNGGFPHAKQRLEGKNPLWKWSEISDWLAQNGKLNTQQVERAKFIAAINISLELRNDKTLSDDVATLNEILS